MLPLIINKFDKAQMFSNATSPRSFHSQEHIADIYNPGAMVDISVILPVFNAAGTLPQCLESVMHRLGKEALADYLVVHG